MSEDGKIDYSSCSDAELQDVLNCIDSKNYPKNYQNLLAVIESRQENSIPIETGSSNKSKYSIPTGSHGFIEIPLDKRYIVPFRLIMLLIAVPFAMEVYEVLATGVADKGSYVVTRGEHWGYYAHLAKYLAFALLFLWLGSFGVKDKEAVARRREP